MMGNQFKACWIAALFLTCLPPIAFGQSGASNNLPPEVSGKWIVFRPGVTQMVGNKPLSIKGDCRTVVVHELYHQPRTMAEGQIKAKQFIFKVCCRAKTIQVLNATYIGLDGQPLLKSLKPGRPTSVGGNVLIHRMHRVACRLPVGPARSSAKPADPQALLRMWCARYGLKITKAKGKMIYARIVDSKLFGKLGFKKSRKGGGVLINRLGPTKVRLRRLSTGQSKVFLLGR